MNNSFGSHHLVFGLKLRAMLKYISYALLLTTVQANYDLPKMFRMHARNKELLGYDSSESTEPKPLSVAVNPQINEMIPQSNQIFTQDDILTQDNQVIPETNEITPQKAQINPQVGHMSKIKLNETREGYEENLIKRKLFKLVKEAKQDVDRKMKTIDKVHDDHKNKGLYKIGYIVSFLNKTYEDLSDVYKFVDSNKHDWDVLKILNSYEKVKNGNDFVSELLNILDKVLKDRHKHKKARGQTSNISSTSDRIAWNYYDDS